MIKAIYGLLNQIGYFHPLHPAITHLPVGLVLGGLIFRLIAWFAKNDSLSRTAGHCSVLALLAVFPTILVGYMDWQQFYGGAWLFPIKVKLALAGALIVLLFLLTSLGRPGHRQNTSTISLAILCALTVVGLGFFGGELVYGKKEPAAAEETTDPLVAQGNSVFQQWCSGCHLAEATQTKVGPGLKDLFKRDRLQGSDWPMNDVNVRKQITTPFKAMPKLPLAEKDVDAVVAYLKTL